MNPEPKKDGKKKMRLLVRGDTQPEHWTKGPTDSPVASAESIRMLLFGGEVSDEPETVATIDARNAFRQSDPFPEGEDPKYVAYLPYKGAKLRVFKLISSLYGMLDASMRWFKTLVPHLLQLGFQQGTNDKCLFFHPVSKIRIALHVDDYICRGPKRHLQEFFAKMKEKFEHKDEVYLDEVDELYFVGMRVRQSMVDGQLWYHADQQRDIDALIEDNGFSACKPVAAPMPSKALMNSDDEPLNPKQHNKYRSIVGSLQYFATWTQWHLAHPISRLAQDNAAPTVGSKKQLEYTMAWLAHNSHRSLSGPVVKTTTWEVFSDSDHAGDRVYCNARSHTGVLILCNGVPVQWRSKKQPITCISSAAAEIYAMAEAARDSRLNAWKSEEIGYHKRKPIEVQVDNTAGIIFQSKMNADSRIKGVFDLRWQWVKDLQDGSEIRAVKVDTKNNLADILTKCMSRPVYDSLLQQQKQKTEAVLNLAAAAA